MVKKYNYLIFILISIFLLPGILGLLHRGFFLSDDGNWMIIRFSAFYEALRNGQFPVRFLPRLNHGYGYPVADFLYPLFMYIGVAIHIIGFNFINTIKIIFGGSLLLSSVFCFLWLRKRFANLPSLVGAVAYTLFPYHLFDLYQRGSIGEIVALAIVPFLLWHIERKSVLFVSLGIVLLILAHNTLALLFLPIIILYALIRQTLSVRHIFLSLFYAVTMSAFFWIPALYDKQFTVFDTTKVSNIFQYFISGKNIGLFGLISVLAVIGSAYSFFDKTNKEFKLFFYAGIIFSLFAFSFSSFFWHLLLLDKLVQFPFRFLSVSMLCVAYLVSYILKKFRAKTQFFIAVCCLLVVYFSAWQYLFPKTFQNYPDTFYSTNEDTTTVQNEYMPTWVRSIPTSHPEEKVIISVGSGELGNMIDRGNRLSFTVHARENSLLEVRTMYFPGWQVFVDKKPVQIFYHNQYGLITFPISTGIHSMLVSFGETPLRTLSDVISIVGCVELLIWFFRSKHRIIASDA